MAQEKVELAHRVNDAFNRRDLEAFLAEINPDVEFVPGWGLIEGGSYHGHDGVRRWWGELLSVYPDWSTDVLDLRDVGRDHLLATLHGRAHGASSGAPIDQVYWQVAQQRDGKVVWWHTYLDEREALEAPGLSE